MPAPVQPLAIHCNYHSLTFKKNPLNKPNFIPLNIECLLTPGRKHIFQGILGLVQYSPKVLEHWTHFLFPRNSHSSPPPKQCWFWGEVHQIHKNPHWLHFIRRWHIGIHYRSCHLLCCMSFKLDWSSKAYWYLCDFAQLLSYFSVNWFLFAPTIVLKSPGALLILNLHATIIPLNGKILRAQLCQVCQERITLFQGEGGACKALCLKFWEGYSFLYCVVSVPRNFGNYRKFKTNGIVFGL